MGIQKGVVQLTGSVGNLTFYKTKDGFLARQKGGGISKARLLSDPKYARNLENLSEFSRVNKASKLMRTALRDFLANRADRNMTRRLSSSLMTVLRSDPTNDRGSRLVQGGDVSLLKGFEFNENGKVFSFVFAPFTTSIDRVAGVLSFDMPAFSPAKMIRHPEGTTHFKLKIAATALDFENNSYLATMVESVEIDAKALQQEPVQMTTQLPANLTTPLLLTLGIEFFQQVNGKLYPLENGAFTGIAIVEADQAPA